MRTVHVAAVEDRRNVSRVLVGNLTKRPLGKPRHGLEDNIKMDLKEENKCTRMGTLLAFLRIYIYSFIYIYIYIYIFI